jgi:hypothetical protein
LNEIPELLVRKFFKNHHSGGKFCRPTTATAATAASGKNNTAAT